MPSVDDLEQRLRAALEADAQQVRPQRPDPPSRAVLTRRSRQARQRRWAMIGVPICTLAATVFTIVAVTGPGSISSAAAATPPQLVFDRTGAPPISALLRRLNSEAGELPLITAPKGGYVYFRSESWNLVVSVSNRMGTSTLVPKLSETWSNMNGPRLQIQRDAAPITPEPLSAAEERNARNAVTTGPPQRSYLSPSDLGVFDGLAGLPETPRALFSKLAAPQGYGSTRLTNPVAVGRAINSLENYLDFSAATPRFLRALYNMLAIIPGVSDAGRTTDRAGRAGIGIAVPSDGVSTKIIVNPRTGALLDIEDVQLDKNLNRVRVPAVIGYDLYFNAAGVSALGATPTQR